MKGVVYEKTKQILRKSKTWSTNYIYGTKNVVSEKLEASTDDILEQFNANLSNMKTIYSSIAKTMSAAV